MTTIATNRPEPVTQLLDAAGSFNHFFTDDQLRALLAQVLPATPESQAMHTLFILSEALSMSTAYETATPDTLRAWLGVNQPMEQLLRTAYERAEQWRELAFFSAHNAVEFDRLAAQTLHLRDTAAQAS